LLEGVSKVIVMPQFLRVSFHTQVALSSDRRNNIDNAPLKTIYLKYHICSEFVQDKPQ